MRFRLIAAAATAAATAALAAVPAPAAAQYNFAEVRAYAFNGCGFGGTCHRGVLRLYAVQGEPLPFRPALDWLGIGWAFEHELPAGTAFSVRPLEVRFQFVSTAGTFTSREPDFYPGPMCPTDPTPVARTCASFPMIYTRGPISEAAWASPDWEPTAIRFNLVAGTSQNPDEWERGSVTLALTPTSVIPEPTTWAMLGAGLLGVGGVVRRRGGRA